MQAGGQFAACHEQHATDRGDGIADQAIVQDKLERRVPDVDESGLGGRRKRLRQVINTTQRLRDSERQRTAYKGFFEKRKRYPFLPFSAPLCGNPNRLSAAPQCSRSPSLLYEGDKVLPLMKCKKCEKSAPVDYRPLTTKYQDGIQI